MMNMPLNLTPPAINPNAEKVLSKRYYRKDENGQCVEDATGLFWRVASSVAAEEAKYEQSPWKPDALARAFYDMMTDWRFLPNSPTLMNAGSELGQLSACFVLPVGDSIEEIFDAVKFAAMIHKSGGGTGFSFSRLRPKNSRVGTTGGVASGPVSFLRIFNTATEQIIEQSFDPVYGARPIKRFIQSNIETLIARKMIENDIEPDSTVTVDYKNGAFTAE